MTQCQDEYRILYHGVSKILRACENFGKLNAQGQEIAMIHSQEKGISFAPASRREKELKSIINFRDRDVKRC